MSVNGQETERTIHRGLNGHRPRHILGALAEGMPPEAERYFLSDPETPLRTETAQAPKELRGIDRFLRSLKELIPAINPASRVQR